MSEGRKGARTSAGVRLIAASVMLLLAGACGDSGSGGSSPLLTEMSPNQVIHNDAPSVERKGTFQSFAGYLAESPTSLRAPAGGTPASARFELGVSQSGFYELFAWWPQTGGEGSAARVRIEHNGGVHIATVDQSSLGGQWNSLGVFEFGRVPGSITFEQIPGKPMLLDAVRAFYLGQERPELTLQSDQIAVAQVDQEYEGQLDAAGGIAPYSFHVPGTSSLPPGLLLDPATGLVSGRPAFLGTFTFSVEVRDASGRSTVSDVTIEIIEASDPPPSGSTEAPAQASPGVIKKDGPATSLASIVAAMQEGSWKQVNQNDFSSVWVPASLRPLMGKTNPLPSRIIGAWSSFAWDSNRGNLLLYGGGHANYRGNEVYLWRGATQRWERASLPSESRQDHLGNWNAIDGADHAPASAHTYDNTIFLPIIDRMLVLGGAADSNGGHYFRANDAGTAKRITGPYLFDPNRAHPDRVGGTTGSHVQRVEPYAEIQGGNMWMNRENWLNASKPTTNVFTDGCTAYAEENGQDVVYMYVKTTRLFRYRINDLQSPSLDTWEPVGRYWGGPGSQTACGYDPVGKSFVRVATNTTPFVFWDLNKAGKENNDIRLVPDDPTGEFAALRASSGFEMRDCGLDFDPNRKRFALWCGGGAVWLLEPPATLSASGWKIRKAVEPQGAVPHGVVGTGVLGKWKYARDLDAFIALQDSTAGNVWIYKPVGWQNPGDGGGTAPNVAPDVALVAPSPGAQFVAGTPIAISASASDSDGFVTEVEFFANGNSLGVVPSYPYSLVWSAAPAGNHVLTATATDNLGSRTSTAPLSITVVTGGGGGGGGVSTEVVLQRGADNYALASETYLSSWHPSLIFGASSRLQDQYDKYTSLIRFAIFQSEGGPVPNGATIESATLSLYKYTAYDMKYGLHRMLRAWTEAGATWTDTGASGAWTQRGANGAGSDYDALPDATASVGFSSNQWIEFDLTAGVQRLSNGASNHGWRLKPAGGYVSALKRFYTSEYESDPRFRPKLVIRYR